MSRRLRDTGQEVKRYSEQGNSEVFSRGDYFVKYLSKSGCDRRIEELLLPTGNTDGRDMSWRGTHRRVRKNSLS